MKLSKTRPTPKLHLATYDGANRGPLKQVYVKRIPATSKDAPDTMRCVASNGRILAVVEVEAHEDDCDGYVSAEAWAAACKAKPVTHLAHELIANGSANVQSQGAITEYARPDAAEQYAHYESVLVEKGRVRLVFNPSLLADLVAALGTSKEAEWVALEIDVDNPKSAPIRVETVGGYGALMPITLDD